MATIKSSKSVNKDIEKMTFEEAYEALKLSTETLEQDEIDLETTLSEYGKASILAKHCLNLLDKADEQIKVLFESDGTISDKPLTD